MTRNGYNQNEINTKMEKIKLLIDGIDNSIVGTVNLANSYFRDGESKIRNRTKKGLRCRRNPV